MSDPPGQWRMVAHRYPDGKLMHVRPPRFRHLLQMYGMSDPIVEVEVTEVSADSPDATHWGWFEADRASLPRSNDFGMPVMIQCFYPAFEVQFEYGPEKEAALGRGRVARLHIGEKDGG